MDVILFGVARLVTRAIAVFSFFSRQRTVLSLDDNRGVSRASVWRQSESQYANLFRRLLVCLRSLGETKNHRSVALSCQT